MNSTRQSRFDVIAHTQQVVRQLMARDRMSQRELAARLGISQQSMSDRMREQDPTPFTQEQLFLMMEVFNVSIDLFFQPAGLTLLPPPSESSRTNRSKYGKSGVGSKKTEALHRIAS